MHGGADERTYVRTDVHDVMAIKPNFLTSMGYHNFLAMVLLAHRLRRARSSAINRVLVRRIGFSKRGESESNEVTSQHHIILEMSK